jgi:PKD repeat protein
MVYAPQVFSGFTASVTSSGTGCNSLGSATANVNGGAAPYTYQWNNGQNAQTATGLTAGNYTVLITDAQGCTATSTVTVAPSTVPPTATAVSTPVGCTAPGTATVTASGGGGGPYAYNWSNGQNTQVSTGLQAGTYTVTVTDASGCTSTTTVSVTANLNYPTAVFSSGSVCLGLAIPFNDQSTGNPTAWNWNFGDGNTSTQQSPAYAYTAPGTYTVTLVVSSSPGCDDTTTNVVTVHPLPVSNFSADEVCAGNPNTFSDLSFIGSGTITGWAWNFGGGGTSTQQNPVHTFPAIGTYSVTLAVTSNNGCSNSFSMLVTVYGSPLADFCITPSQQPITNPVFTFCDLWSNDVTQWTWHFGDGSTNTFSTDPVHSYSAQVSGNDFYTFDICLNVENQYGCWDSVCKTVEIIPEFTFYIPNTFTPNGDFSNDFFFGKGRGIKEYKIWVFDRWGNKIWDCHRADMNVNWDLQGQNGLSSDCQWNGVVEKGGVDMSGNSGQLAQEDVYVWKVELTDIFDKAHNYLGHVNIVR